ncbi:MAG: 4a-hydroxytetrahydrobiopterin dehydratase [Lentisphaerae bacterium GWF2_52_8]|nr:MAG: 4a-hydroxytetrahydrobiopterin dehydratase [Lentisphaerae bacterium GWF2_52_8]
MNSLVGLKCEACQASSPMLTDAEIAEYKPLVPDWCVGKRNDIRSLERAFKFSNFAEAMRFSAKVGEIAESAGHHPAILIEWGRVTLTRWTHKIKGLHRNDFIMAAKTDELYVTRG